MSTSLWPANYIYISHLGEEGYYWWIPCCPSQINDSMGSTFNSNTALGRSAPVQTYSSSGPRTVQIEIQLHRDMMDQVNAFNTNVPDMSGDDYVDSLIRGLQSVAVPKYSTEDKSIEPPLVALRLSDEVFIKGVVTSPIALEYELPIVHYASGDRYAQVRLSFEVTEVDPYDATAVYTNGSFRGVVNTLADKVGLTSN